GLMRRGIPYAQGALRDPGLWSETLRGLKSLGGTLRGSKSASCLVFVPSSRSLAVAEWSAHVLTIQAEQRPQQRALQVVVDGRAVILAGAGLDVVAEVKLQVARLANLGTRQRRHLAVN